jgi:hypothetical protein
VFLKNVVHHGDVRQEDFRFDFANCHGAEGSCSRPWRQRHSFSRPGRSLRQ